MEDDITCDCYPTPEEEEQEKMDILEGRGWKGKPPVALDGNSWPLDFAARMLGCSEKDLRDLIRITGLQPVGTMKISSYRRSGRHPRAYDASKLVKIYQAIQDLTNSL